LRLGQRQHAGCAAKSNRRINNDTPTFCVNLDGAPIWVAQIEVYFPLAFANSQKNGDLISVKTPDAPKLNASAEEPQEAKVSDALTHLTQNSLLKPYESAGESGRREGEWSGARGNAKGRGKCVSCVSAPRKSKG
jgi:hypothetical protein